jgi:aryl-alcohol dehydrogenase-like predicted oxidoreductase
MTLAGYFNGLMLYPKDPLYVGKFLKLAISLGFTTFDTAPLYGLGLAESALGNHCRSGSFVWTKVGVNTVDSLLPSLDYSCNGMVQSLRHSLQKLRRPSVDLVFLHNPVYKRLSICEVYRFVEQSLAHDLCREFGVSVLEPRDAIRFAKLDCIKWLMIEASMAEQYTSIIRDLHEQHVSIIIRSPFYGGKWFAQTPDFKPSQTDLINSRLFDLNSRFKPHSIIVGPRTLTQLRAFGKALRLGKL